MKNKKHTNPLKSCTMTLIAFSQIALTGTTFADDGREKYAEQMNAISGVYNGLVQGTSVACNFTILPHAVTVEWDADDGYINFGIRKIVKGGHSLTVTGSIDFSRFKAKLQLDSNDPSKLLKASFDEDVGFLPMPGYDVVCTNLVKTPHQPE
jgi:hypothetical protein